MGIPVSVRIILCADDFSQTAAVSRGILRLLEKGRLSAVSCMTQSPGWQQDARALQAFAHSTDIGLHVNFTHPFGPATWKLSALMRAGLTQGVDAEDIRSSVHSQLDRFESAMNRAPDFVDGHQHVHVFPHIRQAIREALLQRYPGKLPYLRNVAPALFNHDARLKAVILRLLARHSAREAANAGFRLTTGFAGLYSLSPSADFRLHMQNWLMSARDGMLVMCHPGAPDDSPDDPIVRTRMRELDYLAGDAFADDLATANIRLSRFDAQRANG